MTLVALLLAAWLFGGMAAYSAGFAPLLFALAPMPEARRLLRGAFPHYYLAVIALAALSALAALMADGLAALLLAIVALTTIPARELLMPRINAATDRGDARGFARLHGASVVLQLAQLGLAGWALALLAT